MIYVDTSVCLAQILSEDRRPEEWLWQESLVSSRLLEYESWNRLNALGLDQVYEEAVRSLIGRIGLLEMSPVVLARACEPFPTSVRTLDALHLASANYLIEQKQLVSLATFDERMAKAALAMGIERVEI